MNETLRLTITPDMAGDDSPEHANSKLVLDMNADSVGVLVLNSIPAMMKSLELFKELIEIVNSLSDQETDALPNKLKMTAMHMVMFSLHLKHELDEMQRALAKCYVDSSDEE